MLNQDEPWDFGGFSIAFSILRSFSGPHWSPLELSSPDAEALKHGAPVEGRRVAVLLRQDL